MVNQYDDSGRAGSWPWSSSTRPLALTGITRADVRWMGAVVTPVIVSSIDVRHADCEKLEEVRAERRLRPAKRQGRRCDRTFGSLDDQACPP